MTSWLKASTSPARARAIACCSSGGVVGGSDEDGEFAVGIVTLSLILWAFGRVVDFRYSKTAFIFDDFTRYQYTMATSQPQLCRNYAAIMPKWRNWQTRTTQTRVERSMWVRFPPSAHWYFPPLPEHANCMK